MSKKCFRVEIWENNEMSGRVNLDLAMGDLGSPLLELFDACKHGDLQKVKRLVNSQRDFVNSRDKEGRKSTCLHFAAGKPIVFYVFEI